MDGALQRFLDPFISAPRQSGVFLDFDGTLSPIVEDPALARPIEGVRETITKLSSKLGLVAVVSGRPIEYLIEHLDPSPNVRLRGLYGLQQLRGGAIVEEPSATKWREVVAEGATTAEAQLPKDVHIERKGMSFVLHFRRAPELAGMAEEWAARYANASGLDARSGRLSVEIGPFFDLDKGSTVSELSGGLKAVAVFGDDAGDLPMFEAARNLGRAQEIAVLNIAVRSPEVPNGLVDMSDATVGGPHEVLEVLRYIAN